MQAHSYPLQTHKRWRILEKYQPCFFSSFCVHSLGWQRPTRGQVWGKKKWEGSGARSSRCTQNQVLENRGCRSLLVLGMIPKQLPGAGSGANVPQQHEQIPAGPARRGTGSHKNNQVQWHGEHPQLRRDPWENASPDADHCSPHEFTWLIFLIWWAKLSADIQHPLMRLQVLSTF